jgi:hypothetical protein
VHTLVQAVTSDVPDFRRKATFVDQQDISLPHNSAKCCAERATDR